MKQIYFYLYKITCIIPDKPYYYYGIHKTNNLEDGYFGSGIKLLACIKGLGKQNFKKEIIAFYSNYDELLKAEKEIVGDLFKTDPWCLNLMEGGQSGEQSSEAKRKISLAQIKAHKEHPESYITKDSTKQKISKANKGRRLSLEARQKLSQSKIGKPSPFKGKSRGSLSEEAKQSLNEKRKQNTKWYSEEHRRHISEKKRQRDEEIGMSEETRQKISKTLTGRVIPLEWRKKLSEKAKLRPHCALTEEHKKHISESLMSHVSLTKGKHVKQPRGICPYCGLKTTLGNLKRWHGENCKMK